MGASVNLLMVMMMRQRVRPEVNATALRLLKHTSMTGVRLLPLPPAVRQHQVDPSSHDPGGPWLSNFWNNEKKGI